MPESENVGTLARSLARIGQLIGHPVPASITASLEADSYSSRAAHRLEMWLEATASPATFVQSLAENPVSTSLLIKLFSSSQQLSDLLKQNPQLAGVVLDWDSLIRVPSQSQMEQEGHRLIGQSTSYAHQLDRLRYLKQKHTLALAARDLSHIWQPEQIWRGISDLADVCLRLAAEVVWAEVAQGNGSCPVQIVSMGKLGGHELNYSSDVDLIFVVDDRAPESDQKRATKFAEMYVAALSTKMGRGALYRVDARLRPFGSQGPLVPAAAAVVAYYENYAEPWEQLALIRSRALYGPPNMAKDWESLRTEHAFRRARGDWAIEGLITMRTKIEGLGSQNDIKRGIGGIRDVEFLIQMLQMVFGFRIPEMQGRETIEMLKVAGIHRLIPIKPNRQLIEAYIFLRQTEHRLQLADNLQTHSIPDHADARANLATLMGYETFDEFHAALTLHRQNVRTCYRTLTPVALNKHATIPTLSPQLRQWIDAMPEPQAYMQALCENQQSRVSLETIVDVAPSILPDLITSPDLTELIMNGEIADTVEPNFNRKLLAKAEGESLAHAIKQARLQAILSCLPGNILEIPPRLANVADSILLSISSQCAPGLCICALGSYADYELSLGSDLDIIFLCRPGTGREDGEKQAQAFIKRVANLKALGAPIELDLRLRPEGRQAPIVATPSSFQAYAQTRLETWERLALKRSRPLDPAESAPLFIQQILGAGVWTGDQRVQLVKMKSRVELERVSPNLRPRNVKFCPGGLDDISWIVQLWLGKQRSCPRLYGTIANLKALATRGIWNSLERDRLIEGYNFWMELRLRIALLGYQDDVLPENPDKLDRLALGMNLAGGNSLLQAAEIHRQVCRGIYTESLDRFLN